MSYLPPLSHTSPPFGEVTVIDCMNSAETDVSALISTVQPPVPEHPPPLQPAKNESGPGVEERVTEVPESTVSEQLLPQLIPVGLLVTSPVPVPVFVTDRVSVVVVLVVLVAVLVVLVVVALPLEVELVLYS